MISKDHLWFLLVLVKFECLCRRRNWQAGVLSLYWLLFTSLGYNVQCCFKWVNKVRIKKTDIFFNKKNKWGFFLRDCHAQPSLGFTENGPKKRKYSVSGSCVDENALLMSEVRGEWADWLEMIERQQLLRIPSLNAQHASTGHWGSSRIGSWTPPLLHIHHITGSHYTSTWFLIPLLCWWHTALSLVSTRWSNGSCLVDISAWMKEHHLQLNLVKTELLVFPATPTRQHDFTIQLGSSTITPISFGQKSWCNFWWPADFQRPHCKNCLILPVCIAQHQKEQALPCTACCTTSCPGPCHF